MCSVEVTGVVQGLQWQLSEKDAEIVAARERLEMVEQRQAMELRNLAQNLQVVSFSSGQAAKPPCDEAKNSLYKTATSHSAHLAGHHTYSLRPVPSRVRHMLSCYPVKKCMLPSVPPYRAASSEAHA